MIWKKKEKYVDNIKLPVWHQKKYDTLYNLCEAKDRCKHSFFYFESELNLSFFGLGIKSTKHRICEKCFLWESDYTKERTGDDWSWFGFGKESFNRLTEEKILLCAKN